MEVNNSNLSVKYLDKWTGADAFSKEKKKFAGERKGLPRRRQSGQNTHQSMQREGLERGFQNFNHLFVPCGLAFNTTACEIIGTPGFNSPAADNSGALTA